MHLFWPRVSFLVVLMLCQNISSQVVNALPAVCVGFLRNSAIIP